MFFFTFLIDEYLISSLNWGKRANNNWTMSTRMISAVRLSNSKIKIKIKLKIMLNNKTKKYSNKTKRKKKLIYLIIDSRSISENTTAWFHKPSCWWERYRWDWAWAYAAREVSSWARPRHLPNRCPQTERAWSNRQCAAHKWASSRRSTKSNCTKWTCRQMWEPCRSPDRSSPPIWWPRGTASGMCWDQSRSGLYIYFYSNKANMK